MIFESFTNSWYFSYNFNNKKLSSENNEQGISLFAFTNLFSSSLKLGFLFLINPPLKKYIVTKLQ